MLWSPRKIASAVLLLVVSACAAKTETLPPLEAQETLLTEALIVRTDPSLEFVGPSEMVRGKWAGAAKGAGEYLRGAADAASSGKEGIIYILLVPVFVPAFALGGAAAAHSAEDVDAAVAAFNGVGRDEALLTSLDQRLIETLKEDVSGRWSCVASTASLKDAPCPDRSSATRLTLYPRFGIKAVGEFDPDIEFFAQVGVTVEMKDSLPNASKMTVLEAVWAYREDLGSFFQLAKNDSALFRQELNEILDSFALKIANDLYIAPASEDAPTIDDWRRIVDLPPGSVVRIAQGLKLPKFTTHATLRIEGPIPRRDTTGPNVRTVLIPNTPGIPQNCWIEAVNGQETGQNRRTPLVDRQLTTMPGPAQIKVSCISYQYSYVQTVGIEIADEELSHYVLDLNLRPSETYSLFSEIGEHSIPFR